MSCGGSKHDNANAAVISDTVGDVNADMETVAQQARVRASWETGIEDVRAEANALLVSIGTNAHISTEDADAACDALSARMEHFTPKQLKSEMVESALRRSVDHVNELRDRATETGGVHVFHYETEHAATAISLAPAQANSLVSALASSVRNGNPTLLTVEYQPAHDGTGRKAAVISVAGRAGAAADGDVEVSEAHTFTDGRGLVPHSPERMTVTMFVPPEDAMTMVAALADNSTASQPTPFVVEMTRAYNPEHESDRKAVIRIGASNVATLNVTHSLAVLPPKPDFSIAEEVVINDGTR